MITFLVVNLRRNPLFFPFLHSLLLFFLKNHKGTRRGLHYPSGIVQWGGGA
jgi:hypothetical protein